MMFLASCWLLLGEQSRPLKRRSIDSYVVWSFRPYHALLLLESEKALLSQLPLDCSPAMVRLIKTCSAVKNLQQLAQDADLALLQVENSLHHHCTLQHQITHSLISKGIYLKIKKKIYHCLQSLSSFTNNGFGDCMVFWNLFHLNTIHRR